MEGFKNWLAEEERMDSLRRKEIPDGHIHIDMPPAQQQKNFSCGPACLRAISKHFKVGPDTEQEFIKDCKTKYSTGTHPENLVSVAKEYGLQARLKKNMTVSQLKKYLTGGVPVICAMQAWGTPEDYEEDASGHYVVAIGFDEEKDGGNIYFMDPLLKSGCRGQLKTSEFVDRWHDYAHDGQKYDRLGIALWRNTTDRHTHKLNKAKEIE